MSGSNAVLENCAESRLGVSKGEEPDDLPGKLHEASPHQPGAGAGAGVPKPTPRTSMVRVLLVDDHLILREGLAALLKLESDLQIVGQAGDGVEAIELARKLQPDVVIMDVTLPRLNGPQATAAIMRELPRTRVIGLSMHQGQEIETIMLRAGAAMYLTKDGSEHTLVQAIRKVAGKHPLQ